MTTAADWRTRVGDVWAREWRRTDRSFADLSRRLDPAIRAVAPTAGHALDIGCGAGATSLALAAARPGLTVTGVDLSAPMIAIAADRARQAGITDRVGFRAQPIGSLPSTPCHDLLVSRHGVMFFADPHAAFTHLRALVRDDAPLVFSCFGQRAENRFATLADDLIGRGQPMTAGYEPGPFGFAEPEWVADLLTGTGWHVDSAAPVDFAYRAGAGADPIADAADFLSRIGPVATVLRDAAPAERTALAHDLAHLLGPYCHGSAVDLPARAWLWRARAIG